MALHDASHQRQVEENPLVDYDDEWLDCRGINHPWRHVGWFAEGSYTSRLLICQRCGCQKITTCDRRGGLIRTKYSHPEGYLIKGKGYFNGADVRRETMRRAGQSTYGSLDELRMSFAERRPETIADKRAKRAKAG